MKVKYIKIRADFKYAEKGRFYRVFLVKEDMPLGELGEFIVTIFGGTMEHYFLFLGLIMDGTRKLLNHLF